MALDRQSDSAAPTDGDRYDLPPEEEKNIPQACSSFGAPCRFVPGALRA
ncbi:hypothetical protein [Rhodanobacter lindaniclasticus]